MKGKKPAGLTLIAMLILGIVMVSMVSVGADPQLPKLFVDPPTYTATLLGEVFTININVANIYNLSAYEFKLGYNTTLLDALDIVEGPFPKSPAAMVKINEPEGYVWILVTCGLTEGNGTLATITFNATYAGSASCALHLYDTELDDIHAHPITHDVEDGNYEFVILGVTVATDKPSYSLGENVEIHGNLTLDGSLCQGLVALEVDDPSNWPIVIRTLQTGSSPPPPPGNITIIEVYPSDKWGTTRKENFSRGTNAYFKVVVRNDGEAKNVTITLNAYDKNVVPLGVVPAQILPLGQGTSDLTLQLWIPEWASLGNATVYANVFTDFPKYGGTPYCPEKSATFQITGSVGGAGALGAQVSENVGNYSLTFKLPRRNPGNYTVYVTSSYRGTTSSAQAINNMTFETILIGDVNGDGKVSSGDLLDLVIALTLGKTVEEEPLADLNGDGEISSADLLELLIILSL